MHTGRSLIPTSFVLAACLASAAAAVPIARDDHRLQTTGEVRALWVTRTTLTTPAAIAEMVQAARNGGFNTLLVQVRGRGDAYYRSTLEPRARELASRRDFDPLAETLTLAHRAGLEVHAWVAVNLVSSAADLPASRQHVIYRHPEWLKVPRQLASDMRAMDPRSPEYIGRIARWTRGRPTEVEGLYMSPIHPSAVTHVVDVVTELVSRYDIDGLHLDYVRFPGEAFDYSRAALQQFKQTIQPQLSIAERRRLDVREASDPLAYTELFPNQWTAFRQSRLTSLVTRVRSAIKAVKPGLALSAAVVPDLAQASGTRFQDWRTWLDQALIDVLCPMAYTEDLRLFEQQIELAQDVAGTVPVWAGVGAYRLTIDATLAHIAAARRQKAAGVLLFSYDALIAPPNSPISLAELGRAAFGAGSH